MEEQKLSVKVPFYKKKIFVMPIACLMLFGIISAVVVSYFHTTQVDLVVNEARSSADLPVTLTFYSGETIESNRTIHNSANVQLCAIMTYEEINNTNGVTYTNNLPIMITLAPLSDTTVATTFTAGEITEAGTVTGNILYSKIACA
jgi:hypothetical protein